ncbi:type VII secretion protein EccB [Corynebacterium suicordis]
MRTTGIQVSGYSFLLRRLELALVIGDPRMAHDPLRSQRRAVFVGVLVSLLIAGGAVMMGLLRPHPNINDADLVADESGTLHVRLEDGFHPITNVASARLILREPVDMQQSTAEQLAKFPHGDPVGIPVAPGLEQAPGRELLFCEPGVVLASTHVEWREHAVLQAPSGTWLVSGKDRFLIDATAPRAFGASSVAASDKLVEQLERRPNVQMPQGETGLMAPFDVAGRVLLAGERAFMATQGGVAELTGPQRALAETLSNVPPIPVNLADAVQQPGAEVLAGVPKEDVDWAEPAKLCVGEQGLGEPEELADSDFAADAGLGDKAEELGVARTAEQAPYDGPGYVGPRGTLATVTERGFALISESGVRFNVGSQEDLIALGFADLSHVPWRVISALPDGGLLSEENARATSVATSTSANTAESASGTL